MPLNQSGAEQALIANSNITIQRDGRRLIMHFSHVLDDIIPLSEVDVVSAS